MHSRRPCARACHAFYDPGMRRRWGPEGPPKEAYGRVTNPERFRPLHAFADRLLERLEAQYDADREEGYGLDDELERNPTRPTVRLTPRSTDAAPLTVTFTTFPGLFVRLGHWVFEPLPACGCDACDESLDEEQRRLESMVDELTSGRLTESIKLGLWGDAWLARGAPETYEVSRVGRAKARALIVRRGGRRHFDYEPWPQRRPSSVPRSP
jgi:Family of unknown function (DUF6226)